MAEIEPIPSPSTAKSRLVVLLGPNLATPSIAAQVRTAVLECEHETIKPSTTTVQFLPRPNTRRDEWGNPGIVDDIYAISRNAAQVGWPALIFLDNLSWRQISGLTRIGEERRLTAILVIHVGSIGAKSDVEEPCRRLNAGTFRVYRLPLDAILPLSDCAHQNLRKLGRVVVKYDPMWRLYILRHPDESIFGPSPRLVEADRLKEIALNSKPFLPEEVKQQIREALSEMSRGTNTQLSLGARLEDHSHIIQALEEMEVSRINCVRSFLSSDVPLEVWHRRHHLGALRHDSVHIQSWPHYAPATLREIHRLVAESTGFTSRRDDLDRWLLVENPATGNAEIVHAVFDAVRRDFLFGYIYVPNSPSDGLPKKRNFYRQEFQLDYNSTFPASRAPWKAFRRSPACEGMPAIFWLTRNIDVESAQELRNEVLELEPPEWAREGLCEVPWKRTTDGTHADIFRLLLMVADHPEDREMFRLEGPSGIFADAHSKNDSHLIIAQLRTYCCTRGRPHRVGFDWARVPAEQVLSLWKYQLVQIDFHTVLEGIDFARVPGGSRFFRDPAWRGRVQAPERDDILLGKGREHDEICEVCGPPGQVLS